MKTSRPTASGAADLAARILAAGEELLLLDRARLLGRARQLQQRARRDQPVGRALAQLDAQLRQALARAAARRAWQPAIHLPDSLPISAHRERIRETLASRPVSIVCGDTGSGKTTQLPKLALLAGRGKLGRIGVTQPRRLAAVSMARRVAEELHCDLGRRVGCQVRFDDRTSEETVIKFMTDGILLAETQCDHRLWQYDTLIIDEAHERSLNIDFILGYLKRLLPDRPDLKIVISSATLDAAVWAAFFDDAPVITVEGRAYPIEDVFLPPRDPDEEVARQVARAVRWVDELDAGGDMLVFLPGEREIRDTAELLRGRKYPGTEILPLYARLGLADQQRVFSVGGRRRIVLATNVAETSITIPGIRYVIDSGLVRINRYRPRRQIQSLQIEPVSQASARQRRGRCGRVADGVCVHLYSEQQLLQSPPFTDPEIRRCSLAGVILRMCALNLPPIEQFPFIDPPSRNLVREGCQTLFEIGALDAQQRISPLGRELAKFPLDPRLARMLARARDEGVVNEMLVVTAALSIQDPRERPPDRAQAADAAHAQWRDEQSDFVAYLKLWNAWQTRRAARLPHSRLRRWCADNFLSHRHMLEWQNLVRELAELLHDLRWQVRLKDTVLDDAGHDRIHRAVLAGIPTNIGQREQSMQYRSARGQAFFIFPGSGLFKSAPPWVVAFSLVETGKLYARAVGAIKPEWVEQVAPHLCAVSHHDPHWDAAQGFVYARETVRCGELKLLDNRPVHYGRVNPDHAREIFLREGLAPGNLRSHSDWLKRHRRLLDELTVWEQKIRRPHSLLDERAILAHFDRLLPRHIHSTRAFDKWLGDQPAPIDVPRDVAMAPPAEPLSLANHPDELQAHGLRFDLRYHYAPGEQTDGITLQCPAPLLPALPPWLPERLVPGWLPEKIRLLIRSLPKEIWTACHPLPQTVAEFLAQLPPDRPLRPALAEFLSRRLGAAVAPAQFDLARLPEHLVMKIAVLDPQQRVLRVARGRPDDAPYSSELPRASSWWPAQWFRSGMSGWTEPALPEQIALPGGATGHPALVQEHGMTFGVRVFLDADEARRRHAAALRRLFREALAGPLSHLEKCLPLPPAAQRTLAELPGRALDDFIEVALDETIGAEQPRDPDALRRQTERARQQLYPTAQQRGRALADILQQRRDALTLLGEVRAKRPAVAALDDIEAQLAFLFRPRFLRGEDVWRRYPRYLQALTIRLERLKTDPGRDRSKWEPIRPFQQRLDERLAAPLPPDIPPGLLRFAALLQEFRIAQFAPELGTLEKVSPQRLQAAWNECAAPGPAA